MFLLLKPFKYCFEVKAAIVLLCLKQGSISEVLSPKTLSEITLNLYLCLEAEG